MVRGTRGRAPVRALYAITAAAVLIGGSTVVAADAVVPVDTAGDVGWDAYLQLDASGFPVVSYYDATNGDLKLLHCNDPDCVGGDESITTVDSLGSVGRHTSLQLDATGNPVISYYDGSSEDLRLAHCNDPNCAGGDESLTDVDTVGDVGQFSSLQLDGAGNPVISYYDGTNLDLKVAHCNDVNCAGADESIVTVDSVGNVGSDTSLQLDSSGFPVVSYRDATLTDLKVAHCNDANCAGANESIVVVDSDGNVGYDSSLQLDGAGFPVVSYRDATNSDLKLVHCNDPNCGGANESIEAVSTDGNVGRYTSLALDAAGFPVIAHRDVGLRRLEIVHCNDADCAGGDEHVNSIAAPGDIGWYANLKLDASGFPVIAHHDAATADLLVAHCDDPDCANSEDAFISLRPARFVDTRPEGRTVDGRYQAGGANAATTSLEVVIAGRGAVPSDATAVIANLTTVGADAPGHATVYPCTSTVPNASVVNHLRGGVDPNEVIAKLSAAGSVCIYTHATTDLILDVVGYVAPGSPYVPIEPKRYADTRPEETFDGSFRNGGPRAAGSIWKVRIGGRGDIPTSATTAVLNVTVVGAEDFGHATVFPCTSAVPNASSLNYSPGMVRPNEVIAKLDDDGNVCVHSFAKTHMIIDAVGYLEDVSGYTPTEPARYADTRPSDTFDGGFRDVGPLAGGTSWKVKIAGRGIVPASATTAVINVTVVAASDYGHITVYPCTPAVPNASSVNYGPGETRPNEVVAQLSDDGHICVYTHATTHLVLDVTGHNGT